MSTRTVSTLLEILPKKEGVYITGSRVTPFQPFLRFYEMLIRGYGRVETPYVCVSTLLEILRRPGGSLPLHTRLVSTPLEILHRITCGRAESLAVKVSTLLEILHGALLDFCSNSNCRFNPS